MPYVYSRPYVYSFWQIFQALRLFPALRLFWTLEYPTARLMYNDFGCCNNFTFKVFKTGLVTTFHFWILVLTHVQKVLDQSKKKISCMRTSDLYSTTLSFKLLVTHLNNQHYQVCFRHVHVLLSRFYPNFIQILS